MTRALCLIVLSMILSTVTGCAFGRRHDYGSLDLQLRSAPAATCAVALAVQDQRVEVRTDDKDPDFVGLSRGGYGNPFDIRTRSERPLADDLSTVVARGLTRAGYRPEVVPLSHQASLDQALEKLRHTGARCLLLIAFRSLKSDTYQNTALIYDLEATVFDATGRRLASAVAAGRDNLGGSMWNPASYAEQAAPERVQQLLQRLLDDPEITSVLRESAPTQALASPRS